VATAQQSLAEIVAEGFIELHDRLTSVETGLYNLNIKVDKNHREVMEKFDSLEAELGAITAAIESLG
jgi:hypothetical protein